MIGYTVKDLQKMKGESVKKTLEAIAQAMKDGTLKRIAPAKPIPLTHDQLPIQVVAKMIETVGSDNLAWYMLNKPFYPNRKPHQLLCEGYILSFKWYKKKMFIVEVKACVD